MKRLLVVLIVVFISTVVKCQEEDDDFSYFEIGQRHDDDSTAYTEISRSTDLRKLNHNDIEIRHVALNVPVSYMEIRINANVKTFQFGYLNESSCIIRFLGLKSSNPLVTANVKIFGPGGSINKETGKFEDNIGNKTMVLQKVKQVDQQLSHTTTNIARNNIDLEVRTEQNYQFYGCPYEYGCSRSATFNVSLILFGCVILVNFLKRF